MERTATGPATAASPPLTGTPLSDGTAAVPAPALAALLDGMPRQRGTTPQAPAPVPVEVRPNPLAARLLRLLPTPSGTPFTFAYASVLAVTSVIAAVADPGLMNTLYQDSSTDVAHLVQSPAVVLLASGLWIAGGILSPYSAAFVLVLTALERRIGGARAICVFLAGHVLATLATEIPVGLAVLAGHLPETSLHRLDYGISFGVAASTGALAGLLQPWLRWPLLTVFAGLLLNDLAEFVDPMTDWGHLIALTIGVMGWPVVRRWAQPI
ncbi:MULTISPECIES: rhomboid-like protein [unclassified Streptomyces]|uniref:rhomboid-like protein n=1 Tax=unclassified Streptomyces TaxID=2593676 RepID=UPI001CD4451E|nr:rhomboid-like protein [Streptomyces sp. CoH27]